MPDGLCITTAAHELALWALARQVQADRQLSQLARETPPAQLAEDYRKGRLPSGLQRSLSHFLATYGHRSVDEIDLGLPRWSENPTHVLSILQSLLQLRDAAQAPDAQYRCAVQEAETMVAELVRRCLTPSPSISWRGCRGVRWLRGLLARFCLRRARALGGMREMGRYIITMLLDRVRALLWPIGRALVQDGRLETAGDIFFIFDLFIPPGTDRGGDAGDMLIHCTPALLHHTRWRYIEFCCSFAFCCRCARS